MNSIVTPLVSEGIPIWGDKTAYEPFNLPLFLSLVVSTQTMILYDITLANFWAAPKTDQKLFPKFFKDWSWTLALAGSTLQMFNSGTTAAVINSASFWWL